MRIAELQLEAFGPFTDRALALGGPSEPGLCVIHGENEAGKSSALRAIRGTKRAPLANARRRSR